MRRPTNEDTEAIEVILRTGVLTSWEEEFLTSLEEYAADGRVWSTRQAEKFDEVWDRVMG